MIHHLYVLIESIAWCTDQLDRGGFTAHDVFWGPWWSPTPDLDSYVEDLKRDLARVAKRFNHFREINELREAIRGHVQTIEKPVETEPDEETPQGT